MIKTNSGTIKAALATSIIDPTSNDVFGIFLSSMKSFLVIAFRATLSYVGSACSENIKIKIYNYF